jgi:hypothetical protein
MKLCSSDRFSRHASKYCCRSVSICISVLVKRHCVTVLVCNIAHSRLQLDLLMTGAPHFRRPQQLSTQARTITLHLQFTRARCCRYHTSTVVTTTSGLYRLLLPLQLLLLRLSSCCKQLQLFAACRCCRCLCWPKL